MARAETMLEWAQVRGVSRTDTFDDAAELPGEPEFPWIQRERGTALLGVSLGADRWRSPSEHRLGYDLRLDGQLGYKVDSFEPRSYQWGKSSLIGLRFSLGGGSGSSHSELAGELATGALLTLDRNGSGLVARISGMGAAVLEPGSDAVLAGVGVPLGLSFHRRDYHGELLFWPSLGWAAVILENQNRGSGPIFFGTTGRFGSDRAWFEGSFLRSVVEADVDSTRFSLCSHAAHLVVCTDGWWLHVHDILDDEAASYARVGLRVGFGSGASRDVATRSPGAH